MKGRHKNSHAREVALQGLYQAEIGSTPVAEILRFKWLNESLEPEEKTLASELISGVLDHAAALDQVLSAFSNIDFTQISSIVRCIIKMGIYEMRVTGRDPAIVMDDLLNLARRYDGEQAVPFVNGVLDRCRKEMQEAAVKRMTQDES